MDSTPETLVLASLIVLYFVLSFAELYLRIRRARSFRQWRRQQLQQRQQQEEEEKVVPPPPEPAAPLQTPAPDQAAAEEPANEGGRETQPQQQRRRRRARKKRQQQEEAEGQSGGGGDAAAASPKAAGKGEPLLPQRPQFPLASVAGALQRRIHERYDDLVRASEAQCLTIEQLMNSRQQGMAPQAVSMEYLIMRVLVSIAKVLKLRRQREALSPPESSQSSIPPGSLNGKKGRKARMKQKKRMPRELPFPLAMLSCAMKRRISEVFAEFYHAKITEELVNEFVNCLIEARNELLQRYENVQRSFKIKKAMLSNHQNYRSSYGRLFEQVCRLEIERDNLKKDADIYNCLQERLQESAPYKLIMDLSALELEAPEMSFEELLAKEKEDTAFWQPNGKMRSASSKRWLPAAGPAGHLSSDARELSGQVQAIPH
ncbi:hypothetical protein EJB05_31000 [Eragrostis curvula]|uniref:Uncharacterized protein n=1 Tax=Eragrostis curvula TaxID=38414 RepID=A0A5J9UDX0_9POAL|nr:hypothetical protein EJB05_31000 [Eragrostis curvula]